MPSRDCMLTDLVILDRWLDSNVSRRSVPFDDTTLDHLARAIRSSPEGVSMWDTQRNVAEDPDLNGPPIGVIGADRNAMQTVIRWEADVPQLGNSLADRFDASLNSLLKNCFVD